MGRRLLGCLVGAAMLACGGGREGAPPVARHLVLVTIDTLRADHVGAYGGDVPTPHLDGLAASGAMAMHASAHVPLTRPSHTSLFSGLLPLETGVRDNISPAGMPDTPLLAEVLSGAGFTTAAFVSSAVVAASTGLGRGFGRYDDRLEVTAGDPAFLATAQQRGDRTLAPALEWLGQERSAERLFLWLHLYDPHDPYEPPEPWASRFADRPYAGEVAWSDTLVGQLDDRLGELGLEDETLLVVTSDHGEGLGEHGENLHGFFAYESTLRVPLLARGPGIPAGTRLERVVGLVDLFPTLLDLLGLEPPDVALSGRDLATALRGGPEPREAPVYAETLVPRLQFGWSDLRVLRGGRYKYIHAPRPELYDLESDPGELDDLSAAEPERVARLQSVLFETFLGREAASRPAPSVPLSDEQLDRLAALGYLGGGGGGATGAPERRAEGPDPKDKIADFRFANENMRRGLDALHAGDFTSSVATFEAMLERDVESAELHFYLARAYVGLGQFAAAREHFAAATQSSPGRASAWLGLSEACLGLGDREAALAAIVAGRETVPPHAGLLAQEGQILRALGRLEEARSALAAALTVDPEHAQANALIGEVIRDLGDPNGGLPHLRKAVELAPEEASYWNAYGMTLGGLGRLDEAESAFRKAVDLDERNHRYAFNLGLALVRQGRASEARPWLERTLELRPDFEPARAQLQQIGSG